MNILEIRNEIVIPALLSINSYSLAAEQLVMATGQAESLFKHTRQVAKYTNGKPVYGPARSWWQIEPATHNDMFANYLGSSKRRYLLDGLMKLSHSAGDPEELVYNQKYAASMCRIHYLRVPAKLPEENHWQDMARYWKKYYNTVLGKGTEDGFLNKIAPVIDMYNCEVLK